MDKARRLTDKQLKRLERKLSREYRSAQNGFARRWKAFMSSLERKLETLQAAYDKAVASGTKEEIEAARKALENRKLELTIYNPEYQRMVDRETDKIAGVNKKAIALVSALLPKVYVTNHNAVSEKAVKIGIDFTIINEKTVKNVSKAKGLAVPQFKEKVLNIPKDKRWNAKRINSEVLQGIKQGESMEKIADRLFPIINEKTSYAGLTKEEAASVIRKNKQSAIRNARTMVTQAENRGRLDSYYELQAAGTILKKKWIATADERTREWHLDMDGQTVYLDEPFVDGNGNEIQYPGDPDAPPETVYNCRCGMEDDILGFTDENGETHYLDKPDRESQHSEAISAEKKRREE